MSFFKTLLTLALLATSFSFAAEKQSVNFGVRGAFDYGIIYGMPEDDDIDGNPSGIGFEGGVSAKIPLIPNLAFTPEINIAYINTSHKYISYDRTYNSLSLDVPLLIRGTVAEKFYVAAGPQISFTLFSDAELESLSDDILGITFKVDENIEQGVFDFGLVASAGYNIYNNLFVDLRFYMGLVEMFPDAVYIGSDDITSIDDSDSISFIDLSGAKMMKFKVGLSYWFK